MKNRSFISKVMLVIFALLPAWAEADVKTEHNVTMHVSNKPINEIFDAVTTQTGLRFSYPSGLIYTNKLVSVKADNMPLEAFLPSILPENIDFKLIKSHIILLQSEKRKDIRQKAVENIENKVSDIEEIERKEPLNVKKISIASQGLSTDDCLSTINIKNEVEMKRQLAYMLMGATLATTIAAQEPKSDSDNDKTEQVPSMETRSFQFTFAYPIGTEGIKSAERIYNVSLNCLWGVTGGVDGIEIAGLVNTNLYSVNGIQIAGLVNVNGMKDDGNEGRAMQIAGIANVSKGNADVQIGGISNNVSGNNYLQIAGISNLAQWSRTQMSGIVSHAEQAELQLSGIANKSNVSKTQISSIANITGKGGFQLGLVNIRDTTDGVSLGLVNIVKKGGLMEVEVAGGEFVETALSFRSGCNKLYSILSLGGSYSNQFIGMGAGLGSHVALTQRLGLNIEALWYNFFNSNSYFSFDDYDDDFIQLMQIRPVFNYRIAKHFSIFAGPAINILSSRFENNGNLQEVKPPYSLISIDNEYFKLKSWVGFHAGLRF